MSQPTSQFPGVFKGHQRLASYDDLIALKTELERLITGPGNEPGENGYVPWKYTDDGKLDVDALFPDLVQKIYENTGIMIKQNGIKFAENVNALNFQGKYVSFDVDEDGCISLIFDEPDTTIPYFNESNSYANATVKIENEIIEDMTVPDASGTSVNSVFGSWEPGTKVRGINWNGASNHLMKFFTVDAVYAPNLSTFFEVIVSNGEGNVFASFISSPVKANSDSGLHIDSLNENQTIGIYISDFKEESRGYSFKPRFEIDLNQIVNAGGKFNVKIIHHVGLVSYTYDSGDLLYNHGNYPYVVGSSIQILNDQSSPVIEYTWCSGVKYIKSGAVSVRLQKVYNLNNMAAVDDMISISLPIASACELTEANYDYSFDKVASFCFKVSFKNELNNGKADCTVIAKNAFGESEPYIVKMPVLLNSQKDLPVSDGLNEYFSNEAHRVLNNFEISQDQTTNYMTVTPWDSKNSLLSYDGGRGLMVIPGVGLKYPYGNWEEFIPAGSSNYETPTFQLTEKYFARVFTGNSDLKFGGVFFFGGLTKRQFEDDRISIIISNDEGDTWYNLKAVRNTKGVIVRDDNSAVSVTGVLTNVEEADDGVYVHWSYPEKEFSDKNVFFKLGMKPTSPFCITRISLLNTDKEEIW